MQLLVAVWKDPLSATSFSSKTSQLSAGTPCKQRCCWLPGLEANPGHLQPRPTGHLGLSAMTTALAGLEKRICRWEVITNILSHLSQPYMQ